MIALALMLALGSGRAALGVWDRWGAIRDAGAPPRCIAIAQPVTVAGTTDRRGGFASVTARAGGDRAAYVVLIRLSRARGGASGVTIAIGERRFAMVGTGPLIARAPDAATDRAIVGAMRGGRSMSVSATDAAGQPFADTYALAGAATAIDAASLGCAGR